MYCDQHCVVNTLSDKAKISYYSLQVDSKSGNQKELFQVVNDLLHRKKKPVLPECQSSQSLAERFSQFFSDKINSIRLYAITFFQ